MQTYRLSNNELMLWLKFIENQVGFVLPSSQVSWIKGVVERHLTANQQPSTDFLAQLLQDSLSYHQFFDEILIPRTQFFRHLPSFEFIARYVHAWRQHHAGEKLTAWSVGCSTGQEVVSLGLTLGRQLGLQGDFGVYGSDYNQTALAVANQGRYDISEWGYIPVAYQSWVKLIGNKEIRADDRLVQHLHYFSKNLIDKSDDMPIKKAQCQIIVCKNVLIYFRQFEQRDIVNFLANYLAEEGVLLLGSGEMLQSTPTGLRRLKQAHLNAYCHTKAPQWLTNLN